MATITIPNADWYGSKTITFAATDPGLLSGADAATFTVTNVNDPPIDITLNNSSVDKNQPAGTTVGIFSSTDPDPMDNHTYSLVSGADNTDNACFTIVGNELRTNAVFDFESKSTYNIRVYFIERREEKWPTLKCLIRNTIIIYAICKTWVIYNHLQDFKTLVKNPQFVCKNCGRAAVNEKNPCTHEKL